MSVQTIIFMGSPAFAVPSLELLARQFTIAAVYTQPPRPAGRGQQLQKTPVHELAEKLGLPVLHPSSLKGDDLQKLLDTPTDAIAVVAYGLLLPRSLVEARTCVNLHPSALPRWRGAAPIQHTLLAGDQTTGICIMKLDAGMDTGPVYTHHLLPVPASMTFGELHDLCAHQGAANLVAVLQKLPDIQPTPQPERGATLAPKLTAEDRRINWLRPAAEIHNRIRALAPQPGATAQLAGETVKLQGSSLQPTTNNQQSTTPGQILSLDATGLTVACGEGVLRVTHLQRPGKKMQPVEHAAQGWPALKPGVRFE